MIWVPRGGRLRSLKALANGPESGQLVDAIDAQRGRSAVIRLGAAVPARPGKALTVLVLLADVVAFGETLADSGVDPVLGPRAPGCRPEADRHTGICRYEQAAL
jgi:hypothetical protein